MKEVDTEAPVVWPAWCYSGNISAEDLKQSSRTVTISSSSSCSSSLSSSSDIASSAASLNNSAAVSLTADISLANKLRTKRKSHFVTQSLLTESVDDKNIAQNHKILRKKKNPKSPLASFLPDQQQSGFPSILHQPLQVQSKAVHLFDTEKMLSDRIFLSGYNAIESSKKLCDSSSSAYLFLEKVKNETQMESLKDSESANNNNVNSSNNNNNISNNNNNNNNSVSNNNPSDGNTNKSSNTISSNNNSNSNTSSNSVKKERLSPGTNGDAQFSLSRSRSATPSSFRGTPPQATHNNDLQLHNLSTNLLSQIQSRSSDFSTRNYSDFMRSLAAKYNNSNPNDSGTSRRNTFFENSKVSQSKSAAVNNSTNNNGSSLKEQPSPSESLKPTQNIQNLATNASSVPPFVQNFLSSLPFSPGVFPPLIDMSSTQALVTLARAAKEAEIKNILMSAQKRTSLSNNTSSRSPGPNLTAALQQAAQFASPALLYSAQLQQQQQHQQQQQQSQNRQSSPNQDTSANNSGEKHLTTSPLDLSSAPPTKRFKAESTSSGSSDKSPDPDNVPGTSGVGVVPTPASSPQAKASVTHAQNESFLTAATPTTTPVGPLRQCQAQSDEVNAWTVEDVCTFVGSIDICVIYVKNFREQCIDGSGLPLLTEDHLMNQLGMRLGPALKLRSMLSKKLGGPCPCVSCSSQAQLLAAAQAAAVTVATSSTSAAPTPLSGITGNNQHTQQFSARNPAVCSTSISHTPAAVAADAVQRSSSCSGSIPRPDSADSGS